jgi:hypothetical protein
MATQFPLNPEIDDEFDLNGSLYIWNGEAWTVVANVTQGGGGGAVGGGVNMAVSWWFGV